MQCFFRVSRHDKSLLCIAAALLISILPSNASAQAPEQSSSMRMESFLPVNAVHHSPETLIITASTASILSEVVRKMEPALEDHLTTYTWTKLNGTIDKLEYKYRRLKLTVENKVSKDAKWFVVIRLSGKRFCYRATTPGNRIKLVKSTRCA